MKSRLTAQEQRWRQGYEEGEKPIYSLLVPSAEDMPAPDMLNLAQTQRMLFSYTMGLPRIMSMMQTLGQQQ